jgi:Tfp pilus assembly protein PilN
MSLGLPEFGSRGRESRGGAWRLVRIAGLLALAYVCVIALIEWRFASASSASLEKARAAVALSGKTAEDARRSLQKAPDLLMAAASVESSPEQVLKDIRQVLPEGVSIVGLKIEYTADALAKLDFTVVARTPNAYDRFLAALARSKHFDAIRPGSESRPGLVRANVLATHRPAGAGQEDAAR